MRRLFQFRLCLVDKLWTGVSDSQKPDCPFRIQDLRQDLQVLSPLITLSPVLGPWSAAHAFSSFTPGRMICFCPLALVRSLRQDVATHICSANGLARMERLESLPLSMRCVFQYCVRLFPGALDRFRAGLPIFANPVPVCESTHCIFSSPSLCQAFSMCCVPHRLFLDVHYQSSDRLHIWSPCHSLVRTPDDSSNVLTLAQDTLKMSFCHTRVHLTS